MDLLHPHVHLHMYNSHLTPILTKAGSLVAIAVLISSSPHRFFHGDVPKHRRCKDLAIEIDFWRRQAPYMPVSFSLACMSACKITYILAPSPRQRFEHLALSLFACRGPRFARLRTTSRPWRDGRRTRGPAPRMSRRFVCRP